MKYKTDAEVLRDSTGKVNAINIGGKPLFDCMVEIATGYALERGYNSIEEIQTRFWNGIFIAINDGLLKYYDIVKLNAKDYDTAVLYYIKDMLLKFCVMYGIIPSVYQFDLLIDGTGTQVYTEWKRSNNTYNLLIKTITHSNENQVTTTLQRSDMGLIAYGNNVLGWATDRARAETEAKIEVLQRHNIQPKFAPVEEE